MKRERTSTGIRQRAAGLGAIANADAGDSNNKGKLDVFLQRAARLQEDRRSTQHADNTREAFRAEADLMASIQRKRFPSLRDQVAKVL